MRKLRRKRGREEIQVDWEPNRWTRRWIGDFDRTARFYRIIQGSGIGKKEDNLTSADPLSYTTTIMIPNRPGKLSERLLTCKNPLHSFLWSPGPQTLDRQTDRQVFDGWNLQYGTSFHYHLRNVLCDVDTEEANEENACSKRKKKVMACLILLTASFFTLVLSFVTCEIADFWAIPPLEFSNWISVHLSVHVSHKLCTNFIWCSIFTSIGCRPIALVFDEGLQATKAKKHRHCQSLHVVL